MNDPNGDDQKMGELIRLPLWSSCLEDMREAGIHYGAVFGMAWLEARLKAKYDTIGFGKAVSCINDELLDEGYFLSARDCESREMRIVTPPETESVGNSRVRRAFKEIRRAIRLYGGLLRNPTAGLDDEAKRRLQSKEEKNAARLVMMLRPGQYAPKMPPQKEIGG